MNKYVYAGVLVTLMTVGVVLSSSNKQVRAAINEWIGSGADIYYTEGKVGIGTDNPEYSLDVGNRLMRLSGGLPAFIMEDTGSAAGKFAMYVGSPAEGFKIRDLKHEGDRFSIDKDGNVGLGVYDPNYKLDINGRIMQLSAGMPVILMNDTNSGGRKWGLYAGSPLGGFKLRDNGVGADRLVINSSGYMGINTQPSYNLDVNGSTVRIKGSKAMVYLEDTSSGGHKWYLSSGNPTGGFAIKDQTTEKTKLTIKSNGEMCMGNC